MGRTLNNAVGWIIMLAIAAIAGWLAFIAIAEASPMRLAAIEKHAGLHERKHRSTVRGIVGVDPASTPWCGYAVAYAVRASGGSPVKGYPSARSWTRYGSPVKLLQARPGDIVVYRFKRGYHVAIFKGHSSDGRHIACGGNMSNSFKCSRYRNGSVVAVRR